MDSMSDYLKQLELHDDLEAEVIKKTKVHKVLKAIIKLEGIPKEEEFEFKKRSTDLLNKWGGALAAETDTAPETTTNGVKQDKEASEPAKEETPAAKEDEEKKEDTSAEPAVTKTAQDGDVVMGDADKESDKDSSAVKTDTTGLSKDDAEVAAQAETSST